MRWLRRLIRRNTKPMPASFAHVWKSRLSFVYGFLAWNAFGFVCYSAYKGKRDWADFHGLEKPEGSPAQQFAKQLKIPNAKVIRFSGLQTTEKYEIKNSELVDEIKQIKIKE